jgi:hypothetical protein
VTFSCHGRYNDCGNMPIHFIGRYDNTWARFLDFILFDFKGNHIVFTYFIYVKHFSANLIWRDFNGTRQPQRSWPLLFGRPLRPWRSTGPAILPVGRGGERDWPERCMKLAGEVSIWTGSSTLPRLHQISNEIDF